MTELLQDLPERFARLQTHELLAIMTVESSNYERFALEVAADELRRRNVSHEVIEEFRIGAEEIKRQDEEIAEEPLAFPLALVCLFLPFIAGKFVYGIHLHEGHTRAANQSIGWSVAGLALWVVFLYFLAFL